jgi:hypothetical protein
MGLLVDECIGFDMTCFCIAYAVAATNKLDKLKCAYYVRLPCFDMLLKAH